MIISADKLTKSRVLILRTFAGIFARRMCIIFAYDGSQDEESDYSLILASNRDEYFKRPAKVMSRWEEDSTVIGGRDLQIPDSEQGSWLAISTSRMKIGALLNLPRDPRPNVKSRGPIVPNFVKSDCTSTDYIEHLKSKSMEYNDYIFLAVEFRNCNLKPTVSSFSNNSDKVTFHTEACVGLSNSLPDTPLMKVEEGKKQMHEICRKFNKIDDKDMLIENLILLLKDSKSNLPDPELELRRPKVHNQLSSIFVSIPEGGYGTRTHTLVLITKKGEMDVVEMTMQEPIDINNLQWKKTIFNFNLL